MANGWRAKIAKRGIHKGTNGGYASSSTESLLSIASGLKDMCNQNPPHTIKMENFNQESPHLSPLPFPASEPFPDCGIDWAG